MNLLKCLFFVAFIILGEWNDLVCGEIYYKNEIPHVKLTNGAEVHGTAEKSRGGRPFSSFQGIPYAKIKERFAEAELIGEPAWQGVFNGGQMGPMCLQPVLAQSEIQTVGEEDCLNLYVYVPEVKKSEGLPVMVWIHGGGFSAGGGPMYGPKYLMDEDVILVTVNYRLGILGFLSTGDDVIPGNYGLKDQILALKWVQENIKNFGGDPNKVTVFGESAGSVSVHALMISPKAEGLFHRAISQSGSLLSPWAYNPNPRATAVKLATHLRCPTEAHDPSKISSEEILACLRGQPRGIINAAQFTFTPRWPVFALPLKFGPSREPSFMPEDISKAPVKDVPWIVGTVEDEGATLYTGFIMQNPKHVKDLDSDFKNIIPRALEIDRYIENEMEHGEVAKKIRKFYFQTKSVSEETRKSLMDLYSDSYFNHGVRKMVTSGVKNGAKIYLYRYAHKGPVPALKMLGFPQADEEAKKIGHGDDCITMFNFDKIIPGTQDLIKSGSKDEDFSKNFVKLWVSFAKNGKPEHTWGSSGDKWTPVSKDEAEKTLKLFQLDENPSYITEEKKFLERYSFWEELSEKYFVNQQQSNESQRNEL